MALTEALERPTTAYVRGAVLGLAAVSIWAGNIVVAGLGLRSNLTPWDISAIRFAVAGLVLLPIWWERACTGPARLDRRERRSCWAACRRCCWQTPACCLRRRAHAGALFRA